ncbi:Uncharacterised protein [Erysipelatoclostridium ramosum]|uniref:Uncharacterized protein n=1 Tax=Thomasclavelia ramosa TaxID=1547 RepID=A0A6N3A9M6_9FIRM|nr:hypothetical protein [uncultured Streptococcus sp.]
MLSKKECKRALENMHSQVDIETQWYSYDILKKLIDEHFKPKENTEEYKHFKLNSDSTLKNLTKVELIDYIKMLYHNWGVTDEQLKNCIDKAKELSDSNDELERTIHSLDYELSDVYNPKPYKFEELKPNMWVWDNVAKECLYVIKFFAAPFTGAKYFSYLGIYKNLEEIKKLDIKFEENRFFPVQCANLES